MSPGWKVAIAVGGAVVAVNVVLATIHDLEGGSPGGPRSSSYATAPDGTAAYAELLRRAGHDVRRLRSPAAEAELDPAATLVLLEPGFVPDEDALAVRRFLEAGGRLVAAVRGSAVWLRVTLDAAPRWSDRRVRNGRAIVPAPEVAGIDELETTGGSWADAGAALPAFADDEGSLLAIARQGSGRALLLADTTPLSNERLAARDDAAFGLALAGPPSRPVLFAESYHGYGEATGIDAIPDRWLAALALGAVAAAVWMVARGRRLGPPEREARELPPPRREYAESLGGVLRRTGGRQWVAEELRRELDRLLARRPGSTPSPAADDLAATAAALGLAPDDLSALATPARSDRELVEAGRALARVRAQVTGGRAWRS